MMKNKSNRVDIVKGLLRSGVMLTLGAVTSSTGIVVTEIDAFYNSRDVAQMILMARFTGSLLGTFIASYLITKLPLAKCYLPSLIGTCAGLVFFQIFFENATLLVSASFILGLFSGALFILLPSLALSKQHYSDVNITQKLMFQQSAFGAGAALAPVAVLLNQNSNFNVHDIFGLLGFLLISITILTFIIDRKISLDSNYQQPKFKNNTNNNSELNSNNKRSNRYMAGMLILALIILARFFYVGVENGLNSWLLTWLQSNPDISTGSYSPLLSLGIFWFGLFISRLVVSIVQNYRIDLLSNLAPWNALILCVVLLLISLFPSQIWLLIVLAFVIGPMYPALVLLSSGDRPIPKYFLASLAVAGSFGSIIISAQFLEIVVHDYPNWYFPALAFFAFIIFILAYIANKKKNSAG